MQAGRQRKTIITVGSGEVGIFEFFVMIGAPTLGNRVLLALAAFYLALTPCTEIFFGDNFASAYL